MAAGTKSWLCVGTLSQRSASIELMREGSVSNASESGGRGGFWGQKSAFVRYGSSRREDQIQSTCICLFLLDLSVHSAQLL